MANQMLTKMPQFVTETINVMWSNLLKPDVAFGEASANHNITVVVDDKLNKTLKALLKKSGAKKVNGMREKDGVVTLKCKSRVHIDSGKFPCVDAAAQTTDIVPFGGDKVRLKLAPAIIKKDNSLSLYLNGIQIVERSENNGSGEAGGFSAVEGGFVSSPKKTETVTVDAEDDDLPF
jgi:hypothetical protein